MFTRTHTPAHPGDNKEWEKYVREKMERWKAHISGWIVGAKFNPLLITRYEDIKANTVKEVLRMIEFLGFKDLFTEDALRVKLGTGYSNFFRNHQDDFGHFTAQQSELISKTVQETIDLLTENGIENSFAIRDYL